jgi:hypothetical protein
VECPAEFLWNKWPLSGGTGGRIHWNTHYIETFSLFTFSRMVYEINQRNETDQINVPNVSEER